MMISARRGPSRRAARRFSRSRCATLSAMRSIADAERLGAARVAPPLRRERRERRRRTAGRDRRLHPLRQHTPLDARDLLGDVGAQALQLLRLRRVVRQELLGETHGAERQARHLLDLPADRERELAAAAAEIDQQHAAGGEARPRHDAEVNQPSLLEPGDHLELPPRRRPHPILEGLGVLGLAHRARGEDPHRRDAVLLDLAMKALQGVDGGFHRLRLELPGAEDGLAETRHRAILVDGGELSGAREARDLQTDRVGSDVDRSKGGHRRRPRSEPDGPVRRYADAPALCFGTPAPSGRHGPDALAAAARPHLREPTRDALDRLQRLPELGVGAGVDCRQDRRRARLEDPLGALAEREPIVPGPDRVLRALERALRDRRFGVRREGFGTIAEALGRDTELVEIGRAERRPRHRRRDSKSASTCASARAASTPVGCTTPARATTARRRFTRPRSRSSSSARTSRFSRFVRDFSSASRSSSRASAPSDRGKARSAFRCTSTSRTLPARLRRRSSCFRSLRSAPLRRLVRQQRLDATDRGAEVMHGAGVGSSFTSLIETDEIFRAAQERIVGRDRTSGRTSEPLLGDGVCAQARPLRRSWFGRRL